MDIKILKRDGRLESYQADKVNKPVQWACEGLKTAYPSQILMSASRSIYDGITSDALHEELINAAAGLISEEYPDTQYAAGRLLIFQMRKRAFGQFEPPHLYDHVKTQVEAGRYDPELLNIYSWEEYQELNSVLDHTKDLDLAYIAARQLQKKYLLQNRVTGQLFESPQQAFILIPMALYSGYPKEQRMDLVKRFYTALSNGKLSLPTPIMAGARTPTRQFSSCVKVDSGDSLDSINATASAIVKYISQRSGIGINAGRIRAKGSSIRNGEAEHTGLIPFIKHFHSAVKSCSQGAVRDGSATLFFPLWHYEVEDLVVLKNNKGTEESRCRGLDYGVQINDFLYTRLKTGGNVTLFSPSDVPGLYDAFFQDQVRFAELYEKYEADPSVRKKTVKAVDLFGLVGMERAATGRIYVMNVDHVNNGPFDPKVAAIYLSNLCLTGDTMVATADGRNAVSIKQLAEESQGVVKFPVYSGSVNNGNIRGRRGGGRIIPNSWKTTINDAVAFKTGTRNVITLTFSDGSTLRLTPDHKIATVDGKWVEAQDAIGLEIDPFFTVAPTEGDGKSIYRYIRTTSNPNNKQSVMIWNHNNPDNPRVAGYHVDHIVSGAGDDIGNLQLLSADEHFAKTAEERKGGWNPIHRAVTNVIAQHNVSESNRGKGNGNFSGWTNEELIELGKEVSKQLGRPLTLADYHRVVRKIAHPVTCKFPPINFSKYRFGGGTAGANAYLNYVNSEDTYDGQYDVEANLVVPETTLSAREQYVTDTFYEDEGGDLRMRGLTVVDVSDHGEVEDVYDLTVDNDHNFYVITKTEDDQYLNCSGVLVHNCLEVALPTKPMDDVKDDQGEIALCTLAAFNVGALESLDELEELSELIIRLLDALLDYQNYPVPAGQRGGLDRRALGVGVTGFATYLAKHGKRYSDDSGLEVTHNLFEAMQYWLLKASNKLAQEFGPCPKFNETTYSQGVLPIDRYCKNVDKLGVFDYLCDWEGLRKDILAHGLRNSTVTAIMPCETSSAVTNSINGIEPPRGLVMYKTNKDAIMAQVVADYENLKDVYECVWDIKSNRGYLNLVAIMQKFVDQAISANTNHDPARYPNGKVPIQTVLKEMVYAHHIGIKTLYYHNTRDGNDADAIAKMDDGCEGGACKL